MSALRTSSFSIGRACFATSLVASCSSASPIPTSFDHLAPTPMVMAASKSGKLNVAVYTTPSQPPPDSDDGVELVVTDSATGAPVDGLTLAVIPWMPAMGHGTCCVPVFAGQGQGRYVSQDVSLFMPGEWQLQIQFSGTVEDTVAPTFDVP